MRRLSDLIKKKLAGQVCLLRTDFNIETPEDSLRLEASLPTIKALLKKGVKIVILSHRGRPVKPEMALSLKIVIPFLEKQLKQRTVLLKNIPGKLPAGKLFLLENLRFWSGEEKNDSAFAQTLSRLGDFYVNDAFAVSHRKNASVTSLPRLLPSYAGFLLEKEIKTLSHTMRNPKKPLLLIFGGSKVSDKIPAIKNLLPKANKVLLGSSCLNKQNLIPKSKKIIKPKDWLSQDSLALDIGPLAVKAYIEEIGKAKTIIWNGPLGKFEDPKFAAGSIAVAKAISQSRAFSIIGGGETTQLILKLKLKNKIGFLSTGGGAMLEFLAGKKLPGILALN